MFFIKPGGVSRGDGRDFLVAQPRHFGRRKMMEKFVGTAPQSSRPQDHQFPEFRVKIPRPKRQSKIEQGLNHRNRTKQKHPREMDWYPVKLHPLFLGQLRQLRMFRIFHLPHPDASSLSNKSLVANRLHRLGSETSS